MHIWSFWLSSCLVMHDRQHVLIHPPIHFLQYPGLPSKAVPTHHCMHPACFPSFAIPAVRYGDAKFPHATRNGLALSNSNFGRVVREKAVASLRSTWSLSFIGDDLDFSLVQRDTVDRSFNARFVNV